MTFLKPWNHKFKYRNKIGCGVQSSTRPYDKWVVRSGVGDLGRRRYFENISTHRGILFVSPILSSDLRIFEFLSWEMEPEVIEANILLPQHLSFKKVQMSEKYPKGHARGRHWKHLKQIIQAENYQTYDPNEPNYVNIESPPSIYPSKKFCDITGFEAPYVDPRTNLRYANADVFKRIRSLPNEYVQRYLALRNAAVVLSPRKHASESNLEGDSFCTISRPFNDYSDVVEL
ncbi:hypothetical protein NE237_018926 [Protea cynaroides]|uniref:Vps72/YL1 C-terminal domain-containing protein n=1 Tax=Protea cynaroides TaxID=273540 RepID=A0A9Q0QPG0_9MAGN|nr:hypothetical protein NE237_018926 [Protea cynaroides]